MALNASGTISLAGTTVGQSIACELGCPGTSTIDINRTDVRNLAAKGTPASSISFSDFYGRSRGPSTIAQVYEGGYYHGVIDIGGGVCYYLIVSPIALGCAGCTWKSARTSTAGTQSFVDGYANVYPAQNNSAHRAGNWTATRTINGFSDWYMPALTEMTTLFANRAGQTWGNALWTSTQQAGSYACFHRFDNGRIDRLAKCNLALARAIRRAPV
jgi:hypothetical protein